MMATMHTSIETPTPIRLADYTPSPWLIDSVDLDVDIQEGYTRIQSILICRHNPMSPPASSLVLNGEGLLTERVELDGRLLSGEEYHLGEERLTIHEVPRQFTLTLVVQIKPDQNTALSGFYRSKDGYCTQCEPEGFRRITWFIDRPDVMAIYTVCLHADRERFPVLLANGNLQASGEEALGRHYAKWHDPFKKPSYLFAMVAGKLDVLQDIFQTCSGREVRLAIYVEPGKLPFVSHAMAALKKAMRWDEETFGLECDLDHYMIVAVSDFNMGAMENKGLNIFNAKYILAQADLATDTDFENIDRVVAHEYFHNWTGNRVTCRDWFQLSLKEGLTVFRDQAFGADVHGRETARIREVRLLRAMQFPEDAGPMAHPVRPESYIEINNFYTVTIYEKGAEVVRMIETIIGTALFKKGLRLYLSRYDGMAVRCEEFVAAMSEASGFDLSDFMHWYSQAGTPRVRASGVYDEVNKTYTLNLQQSSSKTTEAYEQKPFMIPVALGFLEASGASCDLGGGKTREVIILRQQEESFIFKNIQSAPVPSLFRDFSAPIVLEGMDDSAMLEHRLTYDPDPFNAWEAGQRLYSTLILAYAADLNAGKTLRSSVSLMTALRTLLDGKHGEAFIAEALSLPTEGTLAAEMEPLDPDSLYWAREHLANSMAKGLEDKLLKIYEACFSEESYRFDSQAVARRRLRHVALSLLNRLKTPQYAALAKEQFDTADNMTDRFSALEVLVKDEGEAAQAALSTFYARYQHEALVLDKWFAVQAASAGDNTLERVQALLAHPAFDRHNPNKVYALLRTFSANHRHFHEKTGQGYRLLASEIAKIDSFNPQVAARLARAFDHWRRFDSIRQSHAQSCLESLRDRKNSSRDLYEVLSRALHPA